MTGGRFTIVEWSEGGGGHPDLDKTWKGRRHLGLSKTWPWREGGPDLAKPKRGRISRFGKIPK